MATRIEFGKISNEKKNAVFLVIYTKEVSPWKYFMDDNSTGRWK
jgi:U8 snoRNA-decapping enzyme